MNTERGYNSECEKDLNIIRAGIAVRFELRSLPLYCFLLCIDNTERINVVSDAHPSIISRTLLGKVKRRIE